MANKSRGGSGANEPLDRTDKKILHQLDDVLKDEDPPPADLDDRMMRALDEDKK